MSNSLLAELRTRFGEWPSACTRREMLRTTLAASAGLLLSNSCRTDEPAKGKRVVVIGAGLGGLACAHELASAGYDVTVFEARERLGGRVVSFRDLVKGKVVEGGGELTGPNQPTWVAYADKFKLKFTDALKVHPGDSPILLNGKQLKIEEAKELWLEMDATMRLINTDAATVDADQPWDSINARALDRRSVAKWIAGVKASELCKHAMIVQSTAYNGVHPAWQSYLADLAAVKGGGVEKYWEMTDTYRCKGGAQQLAQKLADAIGAERIKLGTPVTAVTVGERSAVVTMANGKVEADDVVLAVPPTTWNRIAIDPPLPAELTQQMGTNVKYLLALKTRFWEEAKLSPDSLAESPVGSTWEATEGQEGDGACLNVFSGGTWADVVRGWKPEERAKKYLDILEKLYPGIGKHVDGGRFMDWSGDPWTKGSYSFPAPGQVTTAGPILRQGLGRLHFAGEHCCYAFIGYMEGALNSGASLARRLAKRDGVVK